MKKIIGLLSFALILLTMACGNKAAEAKKEVIVVPVSPPAPPVKSTTVILDKNGVKVETKKVNVTLKKN